MRRMSLNSDQVCNPIGLFKVVMTLIQRLPAAFPKLTDEQEKDPAPLKFKEVWIDDNRCVICLNI